MKINIEKLKTKLNIYTIEKQLESTSRDVVKVLFRDITAACDSTLRYRSYVYDFIEFHFKIARGMLGGSDKSVLTSAVLHTECNGEVDIDNCLEVWKTIEAWQKEVIDNDEQCRLQRIKEEWGYE